NLIIPQWQPLPDFGVSLEKASYQFICGPTDQLRVHAVNYKGNPEEKVTVKQKTLQWKIENIPAIKKEPYSPNIDTFLPAIRVAPLDFAYYNFKGSYSNCEELGKLSYDYLLKGRTSLPVETQLKIKELVKDETNN